MTVKFENTDGCGNAKYTVTVQVGKSVNIKGHRTKWNPETRTYVEDVPFENHFNVGDECEQGSYNLVYIGTIQKITKKCIFVLKHGDVTRFKHEQFARRNYDFDADKARKRNSEWMD